MNREVKKVLDDHELDEVVGGAETRRIPDLVPDALIPLERGTNQYECRGCSAATGYHDLLIPDSDFDQSIWGWQYVGPCYRCDRCHKIYVRPTAQGGQWFYMDIR